MSRSWRIHCSVCSWRDWMKKPIFWLAAAAAAAADPDVSVDPCPAVPVIEFRLKFVCLFGGQEMGLCEQCNGSDCGPCVSLVGIAISMEPPGEAPAMPLA